MSKLQGHLSVDSVVSVAERLGWRIMKHCSRKECDTRNILTDVGEAAINNDMLPENATFVMLALERAMQQGIVDHTFTIRPVELGQSESRGYRCFLYSPDTDCTGNAALYTGRGSNIPLAILRALEVALCRPEETETDDD